LGCRASKVKVRRRFEGGSAPRSANFDEGVVMDEPTGYWWQCHRDPAHTERQFAALAGRPLVQFFYDLADSGWDQTLLRHPCKRCDGAMHVAYAFPRKNEPERLLLQHVVGLTAYLPDYLPMVWEAQALSDEEPWYDFKYVSRAGGRNQSYGLARPAVFSSSALAELFDIFETVLGRPLAGLRRVNP
jgi:hypothetical protein